MKKYVKHIAIAASLVLAAHAGYVLAQSSHIDVAITNLKLSIGEAIQCGGGGKDGAGCKGARGEAIILMRQALVKLEAAKAGQ